MSATAPKSKNRRFSSLNYQNFEFFCRVPMSPTHTGLICVKTLKPNISSLGPFKHIWRRGDGNYLSISLWIFDNKKTKISPKIVKYHLTVRSADPGPVKIRLFGYAIRTIQIFRGLSKVLTPKSVLGWGDSDPLKNEPASQPSSLT